MRWSFWPHIFSFFFPCIFLKKTTTQGPETWSFSTHLFGVLIGYPTPQAVCYWTIPRLNSENLVEGSTSKGEQRVSGWPLETYRKEIFGDVPKTMTGIHIMFWRDCNFWWEFLDARLKDICEQIKELAFLCLHCSMAQLHSQRLDDEGPNSLVGTSAWSGLDLKSSDPHEVFYMERWKWWFLS